MASYPKKTAGAMTLVEILQSRALDQAERLAYIFLSDGENEEARFVTGGRTGAPPVTKKLETRHIDGQQASA